MKAKYLIVPEFQDTVMAETQAEVKAAIAYIMDRSIDDENIQLFYAPDGLREMKVQHKVEISEMSLATLEDEAPDDSPSPEEDDDGFEGYEIARDDTIVDALEVWDEEGSDKNGTQDGIPEKAFHLHSGEEGNNSKD